jgi:hypothetical protein
MSKAREPTSSRIMALDYLRGYFIAVIIIDHLWRWPNLFQYATGRGELWVSAAEGFVIVSGLLVGYIHGYKKRLQPLAPLSIKLIKRGLMLYLWMWITTILLVAITWQLAPKGGMAYIPVPIGDWHTLIHLMLGFNYAHSLTHFLYLYALYLVASPAAIWLLRRGLWMLVLGISIIVYMAGITIQTEWLQWQLLFFAAATLGYYFDTIVQRLRGLSTRTRKILQFGSVVFMFTTAAYSSNIILGHDPGMYTDSIFTRRPLSWPTIPMAFLWFAGLLSLFTYLLPALRRFGGWLLVFGERSLTAYILHVVPLVLVQIYFPPSNGQFVLNTLLAILCVTTTWTLLKIPFINKIIPR